MNIATDRPRRWRPKLVAWGGVVLALVPTIFAVLNFHYEIAKAITPVVLSTIGLLGSYFTIIGLVYAVMQTLEAKKVNENLKQEIDLLTETRPVASSRELVDEFVKRACDPMAKPAAMYFLANTIAVGATGSDVASFTRYRHVMEKQLVALKRDFKLAYVKLDLREVSVGVEGIDEASEKRLLAFYKQLHYAEAEAASIKQILRATSNLHCAVVQNKAAYYPLPDANSDGPHFILIDPHNRTTCWAIIWGIQRKERGPDGEVVTAGFRTTNKEVIQTMVRIFAERTT